MSGWRSTKDGRHFRTGHKPGISSDNNNNSPNHSGTQPSSIPSPTQIMDKKREIKEWQERRSRERVPGKDNTETQPFAEWMESGAKGFEAYLFEEFGIISTGHYDQFRGYTIMTTKQKIDMDLQGEIRRNIARQHILYKIKSKLVTGDETHLVLDVDAAKKHWKDMNWDKSFK